MSVLPFWIFCHGRIQKLAETRKRNLDEALKYHQFEDDAEEEDSWAMEKLRILESMPIPRDARQAQGSYQKAKVCTLGRVCLSIYDQQK